MNREEMRYKLNEVRMMINDGEHGEEQGILVECMKALDSAEGEYIKKSELLQHVTTEELSDFKDCDVIHAEEIDELTTYSFPDSAENKGDLISRQAVLDLLQMKYSGKELYKAIYELPSVENKCFDGMTNGEVLQAIISGLEPSVLSNETGAFYFDWDWWNAPYKAESEE